MDVEKKNVKNIYPLTPMQEGLLFHSLSDQDSRAYFQQVSYRLHGPLDPEAFTAAWNELLQRHDILRTVFIHTNTERPLQVVLKHRLIPITFMDLQSLGGEEQRQAIRRFQDQDRARGFVLSKDVLMRVAVLQLGNATHEIVWSHHHILLDGWSMGLLQKEFLALYQAFRKRRRPGLPVVTQFSRFIKWLEARPSEESGLFWRDYLSSCETVATIPQSSRIPQLGGPEMAEHRFKVDPAVVSGLQDLAARWQVTLNSVLQSIWAILLARYNQLSDVVFGTVVSGRPAEIPGIEQMIGLFINTIPVRIRLRRGMVFEVLVREVQRNALACEPHHHYPLARIQSASPLRQSLIGTHFSLENFPLDEQLKANGSPEAELKVEAAEAFEQTHYDLGIQFLPGAEMRAKIAYNPALYETEQVRRMEGHLRAIAAAVQRDDRTPIEEFDLLTPRERVEILQKFNPSERALPSNQTLVQRFERQVKVNPAAVAVVFEQQQLTYGELNDRANQLAHHLQSLGVGPDVLVGLCLERSLEMVVAILGILKAGGAYVPMDLAYPAERLAFMMADAQVPVLLTQEKLLNRLSAHQTKLVCVDREQAFAANRSNPETGLKPDHLAYVIYTSGSTGQPKGVLVTHANVDRLFTATQDWFHFGPQDVWTLFHSVAFDFSVWELWGALLWGGRLVVVPYWVSRSPDSFHELVRREAVTVLNQTPSAFRQWMQADEAAGRARTPSLRLVIFGGEALEIQSLRSWFDRHGDHCPQLVNMYGITETTVHVTYRRLTRADLQSKGSVIGEAIPDLRLHILDESLMPVPIGVPGEIYVGGNGLARGYLNRPELTQERFISDPFGQPGRRLYKTGDRARHLFGGDIEYLGRLDTQIKIRGFRVELGEIESTLNRHPSVRESRVVLDSNEQKQLLAYVVLARELSNGAGELRTFLQSALPEYMVPAAFVILKSFPLTPNGKLDTAALPRPDRSVGDRETGYVAPRDEAETILAQVFSDVMKVPQVGIHDNYFALGGDSIKAIQLISRLRREGRTVEIRDLFRFPTIAALAPHLVQAKASLPGATVGKGEVPLTPIQKRFLKEHLVEPHRFNQAVLLDAPNGLREDNLRMVLAALLRHHDALRMRFYQRGAEWVQEPGEADPEVYFECIDLAKSSEPPEALRQHAEVIQGSLSLSSGPLLKAVLYRLNPADRLLLVIHHLVIDGVSWRILLEDLALGYAQVLQGQAVQWPPKTTSFKQWAEELMRLSRSDQLLSEKTYWSNLVTAPTTGLPFDFPFVSNLYTAAATMSLRLTDAETEALLTQVNHAYSTTVEDVLLTALARAFKNWHSGDRTLIALEGHGRENLFADLDVARTIGWFTSVFPFVLELPSGRDVAYQIKSVKESIRAIPHKGVGYGVLKYLAPSGSAEAFSTLKPQVSFNYLGTFDVETSSELFSVRSDPIGDAVSRNAERPFEIELFGLVLKGQLEFSLTYNRNRFREQTMSALLEFIHTELEVVMCHCREKRAPELTPADLTYSKLSLDELETLLHD